MKKVLGLVMVAILTMSISAMAADGEQVVPVTREMPVITKVETAMFTIDHDGGDTFSIIVRENASTGYRWIYTISDETLVAFEGESTRPANDGLLGSPSEMALSFKVLGQGVSTIKFEEKRAFEDEAAAEFVILVYKRDDSVFVEEDTLVHTMDVVAGKVVETVTYNGEDVVADVKAQVIDGVTMVPLRATLEAMGYKITWNNETRSVDISKGAQWTSIAIGKNAYFRNKMAAHELSVAPMIVNNRTLLPAEFFAEIVGVGTEVNNRQINFTDNESVIHSGFIKDISDDETGMKTLTLTQDMSSDSPEIQVIIHTSADVSFYQKEVKEGDFVSVVGSMMMTMSMPGQTTGHIIY